uniref:Uncharacterized protein n=1 Tax=Panagrolaimus sp. ES5 TaxID=591445 RepID=A0AC34FF84_9BILA
MRRFCTTGGGERSRSLPRRVVQSKAARKIFPFLASFRSSQSRDTITAAASTSSTSTATTPTRNEAPVVAPAAAPTPSPSSQSINVATTIENNLGEEVVIEDSEHSIIPQCTATTSIVENLSTTSIVENLCNVKDGKDTVAAGISSDDNHAGNDFTSPASSSSTAAVILESERIQNIDTPISSTISQPSEIAITAAAPRVSVESVQVIASTDVINQTDSPGSEQRRYELKCGDEFYVVDVDQRRGRPFTLYKKQESITRPPPGYKMGQQSSSTSTPPQKPQSLTSTPGTTKTKRTASIIKTKSDELLEIQALEQASKTDAALKTLSK